MLRNSEMEHLKQARDHVARSEGLVLEQHARVADLERDEHQTAAAKRLLATLERSLDVLREHLALEERLVREAAK